MASLAAVLVVGADGLLGAGLVAALRAAGLHVLETSRRERPGTERLDLACNAESWPIPQGITSAYLCAAVTSTALCREQPEAARAVNVDGTVSLARRLVARGCRVVFPSTNMVFDGTRALAPRTLPPAPQTAYGRMKAEAESSLLALGGDVRILRLSKVLGRRVQLFEEWRATLRTARPIHPLTDMVIAPISLACAVDALHRFGEHGDKGVLQLSATSDVSYTDVARRLAFTMGSDEGLVQPRSVADAGLRLEHVPLHTTLEMTASEHKLGITAPDPWQAIDEALTP